MSIPISAAFFLQRKIPVLVHTATKVGVGNEIRFNVKIKSFTVNSVIFCISFCHARATLCSFLYSNQCCFFFLQRKIPVLVHTATKVGGVEQNTF
jgi:hypothetical protein